MNILYGGPPTRSIVDTDAVIAELMNKPRRSTSPGVELAEADSRPTASPSSMEVVQLLPRSSLITQLRERGVKAYEDGDFDLARVLREAWLALAAKDGAP